VDRFFQRDPDIVGRTVRLNNRPFTVIGIAPDGAAGDPIAAMVYVPFTMQPVLQGPDDYFRDAAGRHAWLNLSGRLRPGRSVADVQTELNVMARRWNDRHSAQHTDTLVTDGAIIHEPDTARTMPVLIVLCLATTTLILLMVCANVTTLLLSRAVTRRHEVAVRISLGASRARLLRQLLTETIMLAGGAAAAGCGLAYVVPQRIAGTLTDFPLLDVFAPDWRVFAFTAAIALMAGGAAGLSPALETLRFDLASALRSAGSDGSRYVSTRVRGALIANQVSLSLALLIVIGLVIRAQDRLLNATLPYDANVRMVAGVDVGRAGYTGPSARTFYDRILPRLGALPGVQALALSSPPPFRGIGQIAFTLGRDSRDTWLASVRSVSPEYFDICAVRLVRGRVFTEVEGRIPQRVTPVVVSHAFARQYFPRLEAVGRQIRFRNEDTAQIVGIVSDTSSIRFGEDDGPLIYQPIYTATITTVAPLLRFTGDPRPLIQGIRAEVQAIDPRVLVTPETVATAISREGGRYNSVLTMTSVPAALALFLSAIGIYGLTAFTAAQRRQEIGVRVALGASTRQIITLFLSSLGSPLITGVLAGSILAAIGAMLVNRTNLMIDLSAADPVAYGIGIAVIGSTAAAATVVPAFRSARKAPWSALREQ
jgi:predicted permease